MVNSCYIASQAFIISYLKYQSSTLKTLIKKNKKSSRFKNFRRFRGFALHHESAESAKSSENFVILADKKLDYLLTELKLISNLQKLAENWISPAFHLKNNSKGHVTQELVEIG